MSGGELGEVAPESSRAVVIPKFNMHIYTSELTPSELKAAIDEYCIPLDLHPRLPPPGMTMNRLPSRYIGLYVEKPEQGGLRVPFSSFFLAVVRHFGKQLFLIDRRAIPDAMPWRHGDTDLHDDFPATYNENDAARLSEFLVPLRPPPRHLLYVCGLTTACRHPELHYNIKDRDNNVISMDTFLKIPTWTGIVVSKGNPIMEEQRPKPRVTPPLAVGVAVSELTPFQKNLEKPNPKIAAAREKKDRQNLANAEAKRVGAEAAGAISGAAPKPATVVPEASPRVEKEVVDLSGNTRVSTPPVTDAQPSPNRGQHETYEAHSQSSHQGGGDEPVHNRYVPNLGLRNDLRVCTFRACKELISHFATPAEDEFLGALSNVEVEHIRNLEKDLEPKARQLGVAEEKIRVLEGEKLALSADVAQAEADRQRIVREFIPVVVKRLHTSMEYRQSLAAPVSLCFTTGWLGGLSFGRTEDEIAEFLAGTRDLDIEGSKSWEDKHREFFTKQYPYVAKVADSYLLPIADLCKFLRMFILLPP
nr:hypothetical protein [Tanacetum cinerariifolium]